MRSVTSDVRAVGSRGCTSSMQRLSRNAAPTVQKTPALPRRTTGHRMPKGTVITTFNASWRAALPYPAFRSRNGSMFMGT